MFYPGKKQIISMLLGCLVFVVIGFFLLITYEPPLTAKEWIASWGCVIFFGFGVLVGILFFVRRPFVQVDKDGLKVRALTGRTWSLGWKSIESVRVDSQTIRFRGFSVNRLWWLTVTPVKEAENLVPPKRAFSMSKRRAGRISGSERELVRIKQAIESHRRKPV